MERSRTTSRLRTITLRLRARTVLFGGADPGVPGLVPSNIYHPAQSPEAPGCLARTTAGPCRAARARDGGASGGQTLAGRVRYILHACVAERPATAGAVLSDSERKG